VKKLTLKIHDAHAPTHQRTRTRTHTYTHISVRQYIRATKPTSFTSTFAYRKHEYR